MFPPPLAQVWTERGGYPGGEGGVHRQRRQELTWMSHRQVGEYIWTRGESTESSVRSINLGSRNLEIGMTSQTSLRLK